MSIDPEHYEYALRLIKFKVRRICRQRGFSKSDEEVIEHDLRTHLELRMARYDPSRGQVTTFIDRVVERWLISYLRHRFADKRDPRREECSLNETVLDADGRVVDRHETTPEAASTRQRLHDLERDVADLRECLPTELHRQALDALGRGTTVNAIAGELGISRRAAKRLFDDIRQAGEDAGLRAYLHQ